MKYNGTLASIFFILAFVLDFTDTSILNVDCSVLTVVSALICSFFLSCEPGIYKVVIPEMIKVFYEPETSINNE